ncbi:WRKY transcription factor [Asimina triloba]
MEGHDQGDLSDILRASCNQGRATDPALDWRFPSAPINFPLSIEEPINGFGDPFFSMQDPMPHDPNFLSDAAGRMVDMNVEEDESVGSVLSHWNNITGDQEVQMPRNSFSRMLQLSPDAKMPISSCTSSALTAVDSPAGITSTSFDHARMICPTTSTASSLVENGGQQIPSPRNLGIKRR